MKSPQYRPTAQELIDLGAIEDPGRPGVVGVMVGNRVLWITIAGSTFTDEHITKAILRADSRRRGNPCEIPPVPKMKDLTEFEAPPMDFIKDKDEPVELGPIEPAPPVEFDMGRAGGRKILGELEADTLELPSWVNDANKGIFGKETKTVEGWETDDER